jgi:hypothetical protein
LGCDGLGEPVFEDETHQGISCNHATLTRSINSRPGILWTLEPSCEATVQQSSNTYVSASNWVKTPLNVSSMPFKVTANRFKTACFMSLRNKAFPNRI